MNYIESALRVFEIEEKAIANLKNLIGEDFNFVVKSVLSSQGRLIVCGMGKSGIIGKKISATFASTGTPSFFMHPGEAFHGDLGMVLSNDIFLAISNSGETEELIKLLPFLEDNGNTLVAMTGNSESTLATAGKYHLNIKVPEEACPLQLAPTASTTAALVMGDAIAVALMRARDFQPENFARFHPGGSLGRRLLCKVKNEMIAKCLPRISIHANFEEVVFSITKGELGLTVVVDQNDHIIGVITDGDIRRAISDDLNELKFVTVPDLMSSSPVVVSPTLAMHEAYELMERKGINRLLVEDEGKLIGVLKK